MKEAVREMMKDKLYWWILEFQERRNHKLPDWLNNFFGWLRCKFI